MIHRVQDEIVYATSVECKMQKDVSEAFYSKHLIIQDDCTQ